MGSVISSRTITQQTQLGKLFISENNLALLTVS
jgi:hypothetical protein